MRDDQGNLAREEVLRVRSMEIPHLPPIGQADVELVLPSGITCSNCQDVSFTLSILGAAMMLDYLGLTADAQKNGGLRRLRRPEREADHRRRRLTGNERSSRLDRKSNPIKGKTAKGKTAKRK
jgi:hypothetical protein